MTVIVLGVYFFGVCVGIVAGILLHAKWTQEDAPLNDRQPPPDRLRPVACITGPVQGDPGV